jgi:hypothetical protein
MTIHEVETDVEVQSSERDGAGQEVSARAQPTPEAEARWTEIARRERRRELRTAAWGLDD